MTPFEITKPIKNLAGGALDANRGPYLTVEEACLAIPSVVVEGVNFREGKQVDIGEDGVYRVWWWQGGYDDADLVEMLIKGDNGEEGLKSDMTRTSTTENSIGSGSKTFGFTESLNLGWLIGTRLRAFNSTGNLIEGNITALTSSSVTINSIYIEGTGAYSSWNLSISGVKGADGTGTGDVTTSATIGNIPKQGVSKNLENSILSEEDGAVTANGVFKVTEAPTEADDVVRKEELDLKASITLVEMIENELFQDIQDGDAATLSSANTYADTKVSNDLTASTTVAPSKTAVNAGLATKAPIREDIVTVTGNKTFALSDENTFQDVTATASLTVPLNSAVAFPVGTEIEGAIRDTITGTFVATGGVTIINKSLVVAGLTAFILKKVATDTWLLTTNASTGGGGAETFIGSITMDITDIISTKYKDVTVTGVSANDIVNITDSIRYISDTGLVFLSGKATATNTVRIYTSYIGISSEEASLMYNTGKPLENPNITPWTVDFSVIKKP